MHNLYKFERNYFKDIKFSKNWNNLSRKKNFVGTLRIEKFFQILKWI